MAAMVRRTDLRIVARTVRNRDGYTFILQIPTSSERSELVDERRRGADAVTAVGFVPMLV